MNDVGLPAQAGIPWIIAEEINPPKADREIGNKKMKQDKCQQIKSLIEEIKKAKADFDRSWQYLATFPDRKTVDTNFELSKADFYKRDLVQLIYELKECASPWNFTIKNASNPYHQAFEDGGMASEQNPEKFEELEVDLQKILKEDEQTYTDVGLNYWTFDFPAELREEMKLSPEKFEFIKQQIKQGAIPIFMPGKYFQHSGLMDEHLEHLVPRIIGKEGSKLIFLNFLEKSLKHALNLETITSTERFVQSVPDNPYILLVKPDEKTAFKTNKNTKIDDILPEINSDSCINLAEYFALQNRFTSRAIAWAKKNNLELDSLDPLDVNLSEMVLLGIPPVDTINGKEVFFGYYSKTAKRSGVSGFWNLRDFSIRRVMRIELEAKPGITK